MDLIQFLCIWECLHNPGFNPIEFEGIRIQAGLNEIAIRQMTTLTAANRKALPGEKKNVL